jgi:hypothetical protein
VLIATPAASSSDRTPRRRAGGGLRTAALHAGSLDVPMSTLSNRRREARILDGGSAL